MKQDTYQIVTDKIISLMEEHGTDWSKPWKVQGINAGIPYSMSTGEAYTGINALLLGWSGHSDMRWGTYKAWQEKGAQVRKGEKATQIIFFKVLQKENKEGNIDKIPLMRTYSVFNAAQCDNVPALPEVKALTECERIQKAEQFIAASGADIRHGDESRAYYVPSHDFISLPRAEHFNTMQGYYATLLHELTHWTGNSSRLDRLKSTGFGSDLYAKEELVAEMGSAYLCALLGIEDEPREDHAQYLNCWIKQLKEDKYAITRAASAAKKACEFLQALEVEQQQAA